MPKIIEKILEFAPKIIFKTIERFLNKATWIGYFVCASSECGKVTETDAERIANYLYEKPLVNILLFRICIDTTCFKKGNVVLYMTAHFHLLFMGIAIIIHMIEHNIFIDIKSILFLFI